MEELTLQQKIKEAYTQVLNACDDAVNFSDNDDVDYNFSADMDNIKLSFENYVLLINEEKRRNKKKILTLRQSVSSWRSISF